MPPPNFAEARLGYKTIGNIITGETAPYWLASANEIMAHLRSNWPENEIVGSQAITDFFCLNWPFFCYPMRPEDYPHVDGLESGEYFLFY